MIYSVKNLPSIVNLHLSYNKNVLAIYTYKNCSTIFHPRLSYKQGWENILRCKFYDETLTYESNSSELDEIIDKLKYVKDNKLINKELNLFNLHEFEFFKNKQIIIVPEIKTTYMLEEDGFGVLNMNNIVEFKNPLSSDLPEKLELYSIELDKYNNVLVNINVKNNK